MKKLIFTTIYLFNIVLLIAQTGNVGIGTTAPDATAALDITSSSKGILIPRAEKSDVQTAAGGIGNIPDGLLIFQPSDNTFYYYDTDHWSGLGTNATLIDADADTKIQVEEGIDDDMVRIDISGHESVVFRRNSNGDVIVDLNNTNSNVIIGNGSFTNNTGTHNVALGNGAIQNNIAGLDNTAIGSGAQTFSENGFGNTTVGVSSLTSNVDGNHNTAVGGYAMNQTKGDYNVALGYYSGRTNTGDRNVFLGYRAGELIQGSNKLYIENSSVDSSEALIYGEFDSNKLRFNAHTDIYSDSQSDEGLSVIKTHTGNSDIPAILGRNQITDYWGIGVKGEGNYIGVQGVGAGNGGGHYIGTYGESSQSNTGINYGIKGYANLGAKNYSIYGEANELTNNYAGYFDGKVNIKAASSDSLYFKVQSNSGESKISVTQDTVEIKDIKVTGNNNAAMKYYIAVIGSYPSFPGPNPDVLGRIILYPSTNNPLEGWKECDGSLLLIQDYTALFSIIGTNYGGDGRNTFAVPDMRNAVPIHNP